MQHPARLLVALMLASSAVACTQKAASTSDTGMAAVAPAAASVDKQAEAKTIVQADSAWMRYVMAKNVDSIMTMYTDDAVSYGSDHPPAVGSSGIRGLYTEMVKTPMSSPKILSNEVKFSDDGTMAFDHGTYQLTMTPAGKSAQTFTGAYLNVWKKMDGKWKMMVEMSTPQAAPKS